MKIDIVKVEILREHLKLVSHLFRKRNLTLGAFGQKNSEKVLLGETL